MTKLRRNLLTLNVILVLYLMLGATLEHLDIITEPAYWYLYGLGLGYIISNIIKILRVVGL